MKDPTIEQVLEILDTQKSQIEKLEKQVSVLSKTENDNEKGDVGVKTSDAKDSTVNENIKLKEKVASYEERIQV